MERLIVAADVPDFDELEQLKHDLRGLPVRFKIGLELTTAIGVPNALVGMPERSVMLDLKLHDISNTMKKAMAVAARHAAVWGVTLHASAGRKAMKETFKAAFDSGILPIAVTVLTSLSDDECREIYDSNVKGLVHHFVRAIDEARAEAGSGEVGIVCSPLEASWIQLNLDQPDRIRLITPAPPG